MRRALGGALALLALGLGLAQLPAAERGALDLERLAPDRARWARHRAQLADLGAVPPEVRALGPLRLELGPAYDRQGPMRVETVHALTDALAPQRLLPADSGQPAGGRLIVAGDPRQLAARLARGRERVIARLGSRVAVVAPR